jgi:addiction module RelE/StbE family toxin
MEILVSSSFKRAFKKMEKIFPDLGEVLENKLEVFQKDPFDPVLRNHKLHGELKDMRSISIAYDLRVVYYFNSDGDAVLVDIGDHKRVY